jgi:hypothetical protein
MDGYVLAFYGLFRHTAWIALRVFPGQETGKKGKHPLFLTVKCAQFSQSDDR